MKSAFWCRMAVSLPVLLAGVAPVMAHAQQSGVLVSPPVLIIQREFTKPGKEGAAHEATEAAYLKAMAGAKNPAHYIAVTSLTGPSRALFMSSYPTFAAWELEHKTMAADVDTSDALDRANQADGDVLSQTDASVWIRDDSISLNPGYRVGARYYDIEDIEVKPGHAHEFAELAKLVADGYKKGVPGTHWGLYREAYGMSGGHFLVVTTVKSAQDMDADFGSDKAFEQAMGEDGMKKMRDLEESCVVSAERNLFLISPKMSNAPDVITAAEPDFWRTKAAMAKKSGQ